MNECGKENRPRRELDRYRAGGCYYYEATASCVSILVIYVGVNSAHCFCVPSIAVKRHHGVVVACILYMLFIFITSNSLTCPYCIPYHILVYKTLMSNYKSTTKTRTLKTFLILSTD